MSRYAAFLRGMNVGGHRLSNEQLRAHFVAMGFAEAATFRASGNVVFAAERRSPEVLRKRIERGLEQALGYAVPTFIRSRAEIVEIAGMQPFAARELAASAGKLQVMLLSRPPEGAGREEIAGMDCEVDRLRVSGRELYWLPSGGILDSALELKRIAALVGAMTVRTKGTIEQMSARHFAG